MKTIKGIIQREEHLSSALLDELVDTNIPENNPYPAIMGVLLMVDLIDKLGWVEHTGDWDLNMYITTKDGTQHESGFGYGSNVELYKGETKIFPEGRPDYFSPDDTKNITIRFDPADFDDDDEDLKAFNINIWDIKNITMDR